MMQRIFFPLIVITAGLLLSPAALFASDELEPIVRKDTLSASDRARIDTIVGQRVKRLEDAASDPRRRRDARDALIETSQVQNATPAGMEAYASACSSGLVSSLTSEDLGLSLDAVQILQKIDHPRTADALAAGLRSPHAAVRYRSAAVLKGLQKRLAGDAATCRGILGALGRAGAEETNELALRAIYEAINFKSAGTEFKANDEMAAALLDIFAGRLDSLSRVGRDEWKDISGFEAAAACFKDASESRRKELVKSLYLFLANDVDRYAAESTSSEYLPTLVSATRAAEQALSRMIRDGGADPINSTISSSMNPRRSDADKKAVRDSLAALKAALDRTPWPAP